MFEVILPLENAWSEKSMVHKGLTHRAEFVVHDAPQAEHGHGCRGRQLLSQQTELLQSLQQHKTYTLISCRESCGPDLRQLNYSRAFLYAGLTIVILKEKYTYPQDFQLPT